jgi:3-deoxy-D-manno-octulosonic-acid transferase
MFNFSYIANELIKTGGGIEIKSYLEWISSGTLLLSNKLKYSVASKAALEVFKNNKGASKKIIKLIQNLT